jgi:TPP-dependent pyruvate/acetoin dehydrogenase alpha subunit
MSGLLVYNAGFNEGGRIADEQNDTPIAIPVGTQMLHAVGVAYALKYKGQGKVAMTYFGDGATSQGDFHEAMNFAATLETPTVFVCQNNQYAISLPRSEQTRSATLAQKALAYGLPGIQVDGNDLFAVYAASTEAVQRARKEHRPTLIECVTYRLEVHTTADDPTRYREDEEVERWSRRDPLERIQRYLKKRELLDDADIESLEARVHEEIEAAWSEAQDAMKEYEQDPLHMFEHLFAEPPAYLSEQREALAEALRAAGDHERRDASKSGDGEEHGNG